MLKALRKSSLPRRPEFGCGLSFVLNKATRGVGVGVVATPALPRLCENI